MEQRDGFKLYECFIDATFSKARLGGDGIGTTKLGRGVKIMLLIDAGGLPVAAYSTSAGPHESRLVQELFDFMASPPRPSASSETRPTTATRSMTISRSAASN